MFRLTPMPTAMRDKLRQQFLDNYPHVRPIGPRGQSPSADARVRRPYVRSDERAIGYVPYSKGELPDPLPATLIAFYLPQFHTIPENDEWWGKGFTEWRNVTRALPQFEGHAQPRLPGDLGFYDLRDPEVMREQAKLAREYGIGAFCFYFYWFGGKTLLETPLRNWLADPTIDFPFCLCWANEKWSRTWDGRGDEILIDQQHSPEDDLAFIAYVADYLRDPRCVRVDGKPMLLLYRPGLLPDAAATAMRWRNWCRGNGIGEIHLAYVQSFERPDPRDIGFDAAVEFPPNLSNPPSVAARQKLINPDYNGEILDWRELAKESLSRERPDYTLYPTVNPGWDNEPRRPGRGRVYLHASPRGYRDWLEQAIRRHLTATPASQRLVFINAWNEWAEGAVLEPDHGLGYSYLNATRKSLFLQYCSQDIGIPAQPCVIIHVWYLDVFDEILFALKASGIKWRIFITTIPEHEDEVRKHLFANDMSCESLLLGENRGRDILPFLRAATLLRDQGVDVVLKLHTKRSTHRQDGDQWREELVSRLLMRGRASAILHAFSQQPSLGLVAPEGHTHPLDFYWGANVDNVVALSSLIGIPTPNVHAENFTSGSMFWIRLQALSAILDASLNEHMFENEAGQVDGTLAHALERLINSCVRTSGFSAVTAAEVVGEPSSSIAVYPYARRD